MVAKDVEKDITIEKSDDGKNQTVTFKSSKSDLKKDDLVAAIGDKKKDTYKVEKVETS